MVEQQTNAADLIRVVARESTLAQHVGAELEALIVQGRFGLGDRLPPERELAERFGVSRTVIREAVRTVVAKGLLEVRAGSGTIVCTPSSKTVSDSMSLFLSMSGTPTPHKVVEVRRILEVEIAGLAAQRRTADDLRRIETILGSAEERLGDPETYIETDVAFHAALAQATQNELFAILLDSIVAVMVHVRVLGLKVPGTHRRALDYHVDVFRAVERGDAASARQAMDRHMDEAAATMNQALASEGDG